jgi:hypothetical protein
VAPRRGPQATLGGCSTAGNTSVDRHLDRIVREWLREHQSIEDEDDEALQQRLRAEARKWTGSISSGDPYRSEQVKQRVRAKLRAKHERLQREAPGSRRR